MNVPNIGQLAGSGQQQPPSQPRSDAGGVSAADRRTEGARRTTAATPAHAKPSISLTQLACFDVNGDGMVDSRSAAAGGDATLLVPTHTADLPTYEHAANRGLGAARPAHPHDPTAGHPNRTGAPAGGPTNPARASHAADAYQRYGAAAPAPAAPPTPPVNPPAVIPVTPGPPATVPLTPAQPS